MLFEFDAAAWTDPPGVHFPGKDFEQDIITRHCPVGFGDALRTIVRNSSKFCP